MQVASDRSDWESIEEVYVQQWTAAGWNDADDSHQVIHLQTNLDKPGLTYLRLIVFSHECVPTGSVTT